MRRCSSQVCAYESRGGVHTPDDCPRPDNGAAARADALRTMELGCATDLVGGGTPLLAVMP